MPFSVWERASQRLPANTRLGLLAPPPPQETPQTPEPGDPQGPGQTRPDTNVEKTSPDPSASQPTADEAAEASEAEANKVEAPPPETDAPQCEKLVTQVGRNHGHELIVPEGDVLSGAPKTYSIRGKADHDHVLELTAEEFTLLGQGETLRKKTLFGKGHRHRVLVRCDPAVLPPERISACEIHVFGKDGHECIIPESHVREAVERTYDVQGVSGHTHSLVVTAANFQELLAGKTIQLKTSLTDHYHKTVIRYLNAD